MASLIKRNDRYSIRFTLHGIRKLLAADTNSERQAGRVLAHVEALLKAAHTGGDLDQTTAVWLMSTCPPKLRKRMAKVGLIDLPEASETVLALKPILDSYIAKRSDVKEVTRDKWRQTCESLVRYFGAERSIDSITVGDARDFERWMKKSRKSRYADADKSEALASATLRKRISHTKQFFADAVARKLIDANPFAGLKSTVGANRERDRFITRDEATKVLDACPNNEWRLLFALSRFGGLRCPSEHLALRWSDVDLPGGKMVVRSPKTEHHEGKESRIVPIFAELRPYLEQAWDETADRSEFVIVGYRGPTTNLRTHLRRIIRKAGMEPWGKLWANLRSSRATELAKDHPAHVAAAWLGHSIQVAGKHYWQVTDGDFAKATGVSGTQLATGQATVTSFVTTGRSSGPQTTTATRVNAASNRSISQVAATGVPPSGLEPETR